MHFFGKTLLTATFSLLLLSGCSSQPYDGRSISTVKSTPPAKEYWVSTVGNDAANGSQSMPFRTIAHARAVVRSDPQKGSVPIIVNIQPGTYRLTSTLVLDAGDSGTAQAEVAYVGAPGNQVIISGGQQVTGWFQPDPKSPIWQAKVNVSTPTMPRQLYVNGLRATRARTVDFPNYYTPTATGYTYEYILGSDPQIPPTWKNPKGIEVVTVTQWKMMRCPIAQINNQKELVMQQPCWTNCNVYPYPWNFHLLSWIENAYEFLTDPGEWYLDGTTQTLYYIPRAGENMATADVELPVLEMLVQGSGTTTQAVSHIRFEGLNFQHATWLAPNSEDGYALDQSGFHLVGTGHTPNLTGHDQHVVRTPGSVSFVYAQNITFSNNTFTHLGSVALDFGTGSQNNQIVNNTFTDISSAAIQMGGVQSIDHHPQVLAQLTKDNTISNNTISYIGQEYYDAPGIYVGVTTRTIVEHNEINHVPWAGIAMGWGWGMLDPGGFAGLVNAIPDQWGTVTTYSAAQGNQIVNNHIDTFLLKLWDGGAVYSTGFQGAPDAGPDGQGAPFDANNLNPTINGSVISGNVGENKRPLAGGNIYYTDGGSRYLTVSGNASINNPTGYMDFGPCLKASSFADLCLSTNTIGYGYDMGGCSPYGDCVYENNYFWASLKFFNMCTNVNFPDNPKNMTFNNNVIITSKSQVPTAILNQAGRQN